MREGLVEIMKALIGAGKELLIDIESGTSIYPDVVNRINYQSNKGFNQITERPKQSHMLMTMEEK